jgi:hypothetical protein
MYVFSRLANAIQPENTTFDFYLHALAIASISPILFFVRRNYASRVDVLDLILPWVILSTRQWESIILNPYTHTMLPILIVWAIGILHVKSKKRMLGLAVVQSVTNSIWQTVSALFCIEKEQTASALFQNH